MRDRSPPIIDLDVKNLDVETGKGMRSGKLYTREEVAEILHVSAMTIRRLGRSGDLDEHRVSPQRIRISGESVDRHLAASRVTRGTGSAAA